MAQGGERLAYSYSAKEKAVGAGRLELTVAKPHPKEHTIKTVPLQQNACFRPAFKLCAVFRWVLVLAGNPDFRPRWL